MLKKILILILAMLMALFALTACGTGDDADSGSSDAIASMKTIGDVIALEKGETQSSVGDGWVIYAFRYGDSYYRVKAKLSEEIQQKYFDVDIMEEGYEEKQHDLIKDLPIDSVEDLTDQKLTQEELDALTGKTGSELTDAGWTYDGSYYLEDMQFWMSYGPFIYTVVFDGSAGGADEGEYDAAENTKDMKVKSVEFSSLSYNVTDITEE